jgi:hypothetical protein
MAPSLRIYLSSTALSLAQNASPARGVALTLPCLRVCSVLFKNLNFTIDLVYNKEKVPIISTSFSDLACNVQL